MDVLELKTMNRIGLDQHKAEKIARKLNTLLANYQIFYMNTRGFHWNIKGDDFFELHQKFEELYNDLFLKIDEVAERVVTMGFTPLHSYQDYADKARLPEVKDVRDGKEAIKHLLAGFEVLLPLQRELLEESAEALDEGTNAMMSDYIREQEKLVWMYSAYLNK